MRQMEAVHYDALLLQQIADVIGPVAKRDKFAFIAMTAQFGQQANQ